MGLKNGLVPTVAHSVFNGWESIGTYNMLEGHGVSRFECHNAYTDTFIVDFKEGNGNPYIYFYVDETEMPKFHYGLLSSPCTSCTTP